MDRVRTQLQEDACVSVARFVDVREVIERRRDADGVGEKSRRAGDAEEEQIASRVVTGRSHHEIIRLGGQRAKPCVSSTMLNSSLYPPGKPSEGLPTKPGRSNSSHTAPQHLNIRMHAPRKYHPRNVPERANLSARGGGRGPSPATLPAPGR